MRYIVRICALLLVTLVSCSPPPEITGSPVTSFAEVKGEWRGHLDPGGHQLQLTLDDKGAYHLISNSGSVFFFQGRALLANGNVVIPVDRSVIYMRLTPEGALFGLMSRVQGKEKISLKRA